jgi:formylglycine-generating enzyme
LSIALLSLRQFACTNEETGGDSGPALARTPWVSIAAGTFMMGSKEGAWRRSANNEDEVQVTLTHPFELGRFEVTQRDWTREGLSNPSTRDNDFPDLGDEIGPEYPVGNITWFAFANLRSERAKPPRPKCFELVGCTGELGKGLVCQTAKVLAPSIYECEGYRLPTESEWEYAARAGTTTDFYGGNFANPEAPLSAPDPTLERIAWYVWNSNKRSHPVGTKEPNPWGLFDVAGNAWEWVYDWYNGGGYGPGPQTDPVAEEPRTQRVLRGGAAWSDSRPLRSATVFTILLNSASHSTAFALRGH